MSLAWLEWNGIIYWSQYRRAPFEPRSALSSLVEGIWAQFPDTAHFMLRSRIFTTEPLTQLCRGFVVVCAKRSTYVKDVPADVTVRLTTGSRAMQVFPDTHEQPDASIPRIGELRAEQNRSVECWLVSSSGRLLATAANTAGRNRTRHAEMNLLRQWWERERRPLPSGGRLIVTLEPCAMCGGALWDCIVDHNDFQVIYLQSDGGSASARSVLRGHTMLRQFIDSGVLP